MRTTPYGVPWTLDHKQASRLPNHKDQGGTDQFPRYCAQWTASGRLPTHGTARRPPCAFVRKGYINHTYIPISPGPLDHMATRRTGSLESRSVSRFSRSGRWCQPWSAKGDGFSPAYYDIAGCQRKNMAMRGSRFTAVDSSLDKYNVRWVELPCVSFQTWNKTVLRRCSGSTSH